MALVDVTQEFQCQKGSRFLCDLEGVWAPGGGWQTAPDRWPLSPCLALFSCSVLLAEPLSGICHWCPSCSGPRVGFGWRQPHLSFGTPLLPSGIGRSIPGMRCRRASPLPRAPFWKCSSLSNHPFSSATSTCSCNPGLYPPIWLPHPPCSQTFPLASSFPLPHPDWPRPPQTGPAPDWPHPLPSGLWTPSGRTVVLPRALPGSCLSAERLWARLSPLPAVPLQAKLIHRCFSPSRVFLL